MIRKRYILSILLEALIYSSHTNSDTRNFTNYDGNS